MWFWIIDLGSSSRIFTQQKSRVFLFLPPELKPLRLSLIHYQMYVASEAYSFLKTEAPAFTHHLVTLFLVWLYFRRQDKRYLQYNSKALTFNVPTCMVHSWLSFIREFGSLKKRISGRIYTYISSVLRGRYIFIAPWSLFPSPVTNFAGAQLLLAPW